MLAARLLRRQHRPETNRLVAIASHTSVDWRQAMAALRSSQGHPWLTISLSLLILAGSLALTPKLGSEFMPPSDEGEIRISGKFEAGLRLDLADQQTRIIEQIVAEQVPNAQASVTSISAGGRRGNAQTSMRISLHVGPASERDESNGDIAKRIRQALAGQVAGVEVRVQARQGQFLLERLLSSGGAYKSKCAANNLITCAT